MKKKLWDSSHGGGGGGGCERLAWVGAFLNGLTDCSCPAGHSKGWDESQRNLTKSIYYHCLGGKMYSTCTVALWLSFFITHTDIY